MGWMSLFLRNAAPTRLVGWEGEENPNALDQNVSALELEV